MVTSLRGVLIDKDYSPFLSESITSIKMNNSHTSQIGFLGEDSLSIDGKGTPLHNCIEVVIAVNGCYEKNTCSSGIRNDKEKTLSFSITRYQETEKEKHSTKIYIQPYVPSYDSNEERKAVADMQSWIFRHAQQKWGKSSVECADIFEKYNVLKFIADSYDFLHLNSYDCALEDVEILLRNKGVAV